MLLDDFLTKSVSLYENKTALICGNLTCTYKHLYEQCIRLANGLHDQQINRHDRIVLYLENSIDTIISLYGTLKADCVFTILNPNAKSRKLLHIINNCQAKALITDLDGLPVIAEIVHQCHSLQLILITNYSQDFDHTFIYNFKNSKQVSVKAFPFEQFLSSASEIPPARYAIDIDLASLIYTSGTTGNPKGVMLTHNNMITAVNSITNYLENQSDDIILNYLPLSFDYGLYQVLMSVAFGGTVILEKAFVYPYQAIQKIHNLKVTGFPIVPSMAALLLQLKNITQSDIGTIRYITNTGQALPPAHIKKLQRIFVNSKIYSMYGLTECKRALYLPPSELNNRPESVGIAIPNTEVWLIDENGNKILEPNVIGELVIRGAHVMKGYWNSSIETDAVLTTGIFPDEKNLLSGDLFKMDHDGFYYFISRKDDVIKCGGERISPKEIETILHEIPQVCEAAVIGVPDPILGNVIKAFIVVKDGCVIHQNTILQYCTLHLEHSHIPKYIEFVKSLPKGTNGKVQKKNLSKDLFKLNGTTKLTG